ncbi:cytochrome P450 3A24-like [Orbicella faveolata]|uniref:cytochrome P450 3A24-like n=1 Tax=Orbicella faveolata TaxID=48498 RepID=UPI0009E243A1|nr:cytochrome P450 3A24-like [Orbicella faveolata]XP_020602331.1 cytochrome P450 3A24-like [Orbicella faveolata]XP_020602336.1 cytochrome P450 3A24-like [Orbicella faveolata]
MMESLRNILSLESLVHPAAITTLSLLVVSLFLYWCGTRGFADLKKLNVPHIPKPVPFLGNFLEVRKYNGMHLLCLDYVKKYGKVFAICLGAKPSLVVADPELLKLILIKDFPNFRDRYIFQFPGAPFNKNVFHSQGNSWKRIRNILTPTFSAGKMKLMVPLMEKSCDTLMEKLEKIADSGESVDMLDWFSQLTFEVILSTAFGVDANIQMGENTEMLQKAQAIFRIPLIVRQIERLPFGTLLFSVLGAIFGNQPTYFLGIVDEIIKTRRQQGLMGRKDLLQLMMTAKDETTVEGVSRLTDEEIVAQSVFFLLAGYETSSNTLSFTAYFLATNPDVQEKLRADIKDAMESNTDISLYDLTHSIEYLDCVIKESQRMCPPGVQATRECSEDYDLNGIHIPAGTEILIPIYALHHDPDAWQNPETFDPERFRGSSKDAIHAFQFLPFGAGPRNCIGMRFALMEIKIALVKILLRYKFVQSPETQVPLIIHPGGSLSARDGVRVRVETLV